VSDQDLRGRLLTILDVEEQVYVKLRDVLQHERELMVALDAAGLEEVARDKSALADEGRLVEESRIEVAGRLARELGIAEERPTLSMICAELGADAGALRAAHTRLLVLVSVVRELLDANVAFAGEHLSQIRGTLRLLGGMIPLEPVYERNPQPGGSGGMGVGHLVQRTA